MKVIVPNDKVKTDSKEVKNFLNLLKKGKAYKIYFVQNKKEATIFIFKSFEIIKNSIVRINFYKPIIIKSEVGENSIYESSMDEYGLGDFFDILSEFNFAKQELTLPKINENFLLRMEFLKLKIKNYH